MPTVLIVDDSPTFRMSIRKALEEINIKIIGEAGNGIGALSRIKRRKPDLVLLDIFMPKMDGLTTLQEIMRTCPTRVLVMSAFKPENANVVLTALDYGAITYINKSSSNQSLDNTFKKELQRKVSECIQSKIPKPSRRMITINHSVGENTPNGKCKKLKLIPSRSLVVIGSSAGGPQTLRELLPHLKPPFPPTIIVQHLPVGFSSDFAVRLDNKTRLTVVEAKNGMGLSTNTIYIAPGGKHLVLNEVGNQIEFFLCKTDNISGVMPSLDPTLISASYYFREKLVVVVLTGMGADGLAGTRYSRSHGAYVIAQSEKSSLVYGMPKAIIDENLADSIGSPLIISSCLNSIFSGNASNDRNARKQ